MIQILRSTSKLCKGLVTKSFKALQTSWYLKLESSGFKDIEDLKHPSRPLKEWHSFKIPSEKFQLMKQNKSQYQKQIDEFLIHPGFLDACKSVIKHGNCKFTIEQAKLIWTLHVEGLTTRQIAKELNRAKNRTDSIIEKLRKWMNLL
jgi:hypothetical protein